MTDEEFDLFVEESTKELNRKQKSLVKTYRLGKWDEYFYDTPSGELQFKDNKGAVQVRADTVPLGSYSTTSGTWQWAWANKSTPTAVRKQAEELKKLFKRTGIDVFKMPAIEIDEPMVWELAAMSVSHLGAKGCYHMAAGADGHLNVFVALMDVRSEKESGGRS
jgi:hypothetical protein